MAKEEKNLLKLLKSNNDNNINNNSNNSNSINNICKCNNLCDKCYNNDFPLLWNELRTCNQLYDGIICLPNNINIKVHRTILSSSSLYFKASFTYNNKNNDNDETIIHVDTTEEIMNLILDYAYTGNCLISWCNVEELLSASDRFEVVGLIKLCCKFLLNELQIYNCIGIYLYAKYYFCYDLEMITKKFILNNFKLIINDNYEIYNINFTDLYNILNDEYLNVNNEEYVFDIIKKWIEYDINKRINDLPKLLTCVRFGLMGYKFFRERFMSWTPIKQNHECQKVIIPALNYLTELSLHPTTRYDFNHPLSRPRVPYEIIMVIGGWTSGSPTNIIETYDTRADVWLKMQVTDTKRAYHGVCSIEHKVYVLGGFDGTNHFNSMRCYDATICLWEEKACMYHPRCYVSVVAHNNMIYAMGGYNGHTRLDSVERYDPERNQWEMIAPMRRLRSDAGAAALGDNIYIVGGFNGTEVLNSCEMYNPVINKWTLISFMLSPRSGVGLVAFNDALYAIGGFSGHHRLCSVEKYSLTEPNWTFVAEMMCPRSNFASVIAENTIYAIGGFNGTHTISYVESYDPILNMWQAARQMAINRSAQSACVLKGLPNIKEYSLHSREIPNAPCVYLEIDLNNTVYNEFLNDNNMNNNNNIHNNNVDNNMDIEWDRGEHQHNIF